MQKVVGSSPIVSTTREQVGRSDRPARESGCRAEGAIGGAFCSPTSWTASTDMSGWRRWRLTFFVDTQPSAELGDLVEPAGFRLATVTPTAGPMRLVQA